MPIFKYSRFNAWWNGRQDGKRGIPPVDQEQYSPYELELQNLAEENIQRVAQKWERLDKKLKGEYCKRLFEYRKAEEACKAAAGD